VYSPSQLRKYELCAHFKPESEDKSSAAADEGTMLHKACETGDLRGLDCEQREMVERCLGYVESIVKPEGTQVHKEVRVSIPRVTRGTIDMLIVKPDGVAHLLDYKFGRNPVDDARENIQGQAYAVGAFRKFPRVHTIIVAFLCPRQMDENEPHVYRRQDIPRILMRIAAIKAAVRQRNAPYTPNDKACLWCSRRRSCPALAGCALAVASKQSNLLLPSEFNPGTMITPEDRGKAQALASLLEAWAAEVRAANLRAVVEEGVQIPGYQVVRRCGSRRVVAMEPLFDELLRYGICLNDFLSRCTIPVSEVEKLVAYAMELAAGAETDLDPEIKAAMKGGSKAILNQLNQRLEERQIIQRGNEVLYLAKTKCKAIEK
jgi:hypothetical protein